MEVKGDFDGFMSMSIVLVIFLLFGMCFINGF